MWAGFLIDTELALSYTAVMYKGGEAMPTRLASLAIGTGDIDCVYHMARPELISSVEESGNEDQLDMVNTLISGKRLRDISDLPFDLVS